MYDINPVRYAYEKGYRVDEKGVVYSPTGILRKVQIKNKKDDTRPCYKHFTISMPREGGRCFPKILVHQLQSYQKYGAAMFDPALVVRHLDGDSLNNKESNIALGTQSDNMLDQPKEKRIALAKNANRKKEENNV